MRRMIALLLAALMLVAMTACGAKNETADTSAPADTAATETTSTETADTSDAAESTETADTAAIPGLEDGVFTVGMECALSLIHIFNTDAHRIAGWCSIVAEDLPHLMKQANG